MALTADNFATLLRTLLPPGAAWRAEIGSSLRKLLTGLAGELARVNTRADDLLREADPNQTLELLPDWERVYGLPDSCSKEAGTIADRRQQLLYKVAAAGGQSRAYFIEICRQFGYTVTITEYGPFQAGRSSAGDPCCDDTWRHYWEVNASEFLVTYFEAGKSGAGDAIRTWSNDVLECIVGKKKPAHTKVRFTYGS